ncbi:glycosyltransferase family 2 protein [Rhodococcus sp. BP-241]|uniref:glycosyltransferase family 2 protein n=1 Tax=Rhodococcus sp. BP-241 TaxID=2739441 RepID=UPI001C9B2D10|nr:glycosyltransferase family 2 protein [Rhodococcus sp. BP-241]MBY6709513.1 glycosyltransferase family 2 protein [Rhodococcus sp. BP-241]
MIVNYYTSEMVADLLQSLQESKIDTICIVDNSVDTAELSKLKQLECNDTSIVVVPSVSNSGFGAAVNAAIEHLDPSMDDLVWIINPDTIAESDCLNKIEQTLTRYPNSVVSPLITFGDRGHVWFAGGSVDIRKGRVEHQPYDSAPDLQTLEPYNVGFMCGAAPAFRYQTWKLLQGFRDDLFMYWEDVDLSIRANQSGIALMIDPAARMWHKVGASSGNEGQSSLYYYYAARNRILVCNTANRTSIYSASFFLENAKFLLRPLRREHHEKISKAASVVRGSLAGYRMVRLTSESTTVS